MYYNNSLQQFITTIHYNNSLQHILRLLYCILYIKTIVLYFRY